MRCSALAASLWISVVMSTDVEAEQLRARARGLRAVSAQLGASRALVIHGLAGPDTWVGPTPQACHDALLTIRRRLLAHQDALLETARTFERRADDLARQPTVVNRRS